MPAESFQRILEVPTDTASVWEILTDVERVARWVSVIEEVEEVDHLDSYRAVLEDRLGPFRLRADLDVDVQGLTEGESISFQADGEDRQMASRIRVEASMQLSASDGGTRIEVSGEYEVSGRVASLGTSTIRSKAAKILDDFFGSAERELSGT